MGTKTDRSVPNGASEPQDSRDAGCGLNTRSDPPRPDDLRPWPGSFDSRPVCPHERMAAVAYLGAPRSRSLRESVEVLNARGLELLDAIALALREGRARRRGNGRGESGRGGSSVPGSGAEPQRIARVLSRVLSDAVADLAFEHTIDAYERWPLPRLEELGRAVVRLPPVPEQRGYVFTCACGASFGTRAFTEDEAARHAEEHGWVIRLKGEPEDVDGEIQPAPVTRAWCRDCIR